MPTPQPTKKKIKVPKVVNGVPTEVEIEVDDVQGPTWGDKAAHRLLNTKIPRPDGPAKTTGTAVYTYDVRLPGMQHGRFVLSPHARATVKSVDTSAAEKIIGVTLVMPFGKEVDYEGEPFVAVCAKTREAADDAVRAVVVEYDVKPFVVKTAAAMTDDGKKLFPNERPRRSNGSVDEVVEKFAGCDAVVEAEYVTKIMHHACLETHGIVCDYRGGDTATVYCSTQGTHSIPGDAAKALGLKQTQVTGVVQNMGGGFGSKFGIGIAGQWGCRMSKKLGVPVKMMLTRRDEFLTAGNGPGSVQRLKAGVTKDGTLVAMTYDQYGLPGVSRSNIAAMPYQYKAQHAAGKYTIVHTNEDGSVAMRAPGFPQASFAMESLMDELAEKIGMDPVEFRKKNATNDSHRRQLDKGAEVIGWSKRGLKSLSDKPAGPLKRGFGCGIGAWGGGGGPKCVVDVTVGQDASVSVTVGSQDLGTGTRAYVQAIVAEELGLDLKDVKEQIGSTKLGDANASGGSTTAASLAPAVKDAAFKAKQLLAQYVAPLLGVEAAAVTFADRKVTAGDKSLSWEQAAKAVPAAGMTVSGTWQPGLSGNGAHGASFAEVEVDTETGHVKVVKMCHVQDGGLILNRLATESQINGGMIQSIGMALFEERVMDERLGVMLNPGFGDYKLPGCLEIGELIPVIDDGDTRNAVIGIAEPANIPGVGAIANAVYNACGVRVRELPITPDKILNALYAKEVKKA